MEIVSGVYTIEELGVGRAYLYEEADRLTLIDTGLPGSAERVFDAMESIRRKPEDLGQIVVTHHHRDHTGSLADIAERSGATVLVHAIDAPVVRGDQPPPTPQPLSGRLLAGRSKPPAPTPVDRELADGDEIDLGGIAHVIHTPGHTAGSIALYVPARKLLFAGDAAKNGMGLGPPTGAFGMFNEDAAAVKASFRKLAQLDFEVACFGHGRPLDKDASAAFRQAAEKLG